MAISQYIAIKDILGTGAADFVDSAKGEQVCFIDIFQYHLQNIDRQVGGHQGSSVNSVDVYSVYVYGVGIWEYPKLPSLLFTQSTPSSNGEGYRNPKPMQTLSHSHHRLK
jgi:hypothetical protein